MEPMKCVYVLIPLQTHAKDETIRRQYLNKATLIGGQIYDRGYCPVIPHFYAWTFRDYRPEKECLSIRISLLSFCDYVYCPSFDEFMNEERKLIENMGIKIIQDVRDLPLLYAQKNNG